jgi:uncharacterized membrane protein
MKHLSLRLAGALASLALLQPLASVADVLSTQSTGAGTITGLSADGKVAVGEANRTFEAFRWTAETGLVKLGRGTQPKLGQRSGVPSMSADGTVVGATILSDDGKSATGGRWTAATGWQMLRPLPADAGLMDREDSSVWAMSRDGAVLAGLYWRPSSTGGQAHGMAWSAAFGMLDMGSSGANSRINGANADGSVLVGWDESPAGGNRRAAVWADGKLTVLVNSDYGSEAYAVNSAGTIVVGYSADPANGNKTSATKWTKTAGGWATQILGVLSKSRKQGAAYPNGLSDDGSVVVGIGRLDSMSPAGYGFYWSEATGFVDVVDYMATNGLTLPVGLSVTSLTAVNADGRVLAAQVQNRKTGTVSGVLIRREPGAAR